MAIFNIPVHILSPSESLQTLVGYLFTLNALRNRIKTKNFQKLVSTNIFYYERGLDAALKKI